MDFLNIPTHKEKIKLSKIIFNEDIYPREHQAHDPNLVNKYVKDIDVIESASNIYLSADYNLIDGRHRQLAFETVYGKDYELEVLIFETIETKIKYALSNFYNSQSGRQLTQQAKRANAITMYSKYGFTQDEIAKSLSTRKSNVSHWLTTILEQEKEERDHKVIEMYLRAWNTQESIAEELGVTHKTISNIIGKIVPGNEITKNFKPFLYNIWNLHKAEKDTSHFGHFPQIFMDNLLYYHSKPLDIVYDPFAGDGTTIESCKDMFRRYYCSDKDVKPGREKDIKQWNIQDGLPDDLQKPNLVFLDPPYWKQAEGKYSDDSKDLSNMNLIEFNNTIENFLDEIRKRKVQRIAIIIQPTQYANNFDVIDHIFDFHQMLLKNYRIEMRYILPYSTQQYNAQMVGKGKDNKKCLILHRDLIIWSIRDTKKK